MRREQPHHTATIRREWIYNRKRSDRRRHIHRNAMRGIVELRQRIGEIAGLTAELRADRICLELPLSADRELNEHSGERCQKEHQQGNERVTAEGVAAASVAPSAAEEQREVCEITDRARQRRRERLHEHVAILDVRELVCKHTAKLRRR